MTRIASALSTPLLAGSLCLFAASAAADEVLRGDVTLKDSSRAPFILSGPSRANVVGGQIQLGERRYLITHVSRYKLVGAQRIADGEKGEQIAQPEFVVFSSSYSRQTGVGTPWVAAQEAIGCDQAYNSFLAIYGFANAERAQALGTVPFAALHDDLANSDVSVVYCFMSSPPETSPAAAAPGN